MGEMTVEEMKRKVDEEGQRRSKECWGKIEAVANEYGMIVTGIPAFTPDGRVVVKVGLVPKQEVDNG